MNIVQPAARSVPRVLTVIGILAICLGSSSRSCTLGGIGGGGNGDDPSFVTELTLQDINGQITDSFERDEQIEMVLTVRNRLDRSVSVDFETTRTSDFVVVRENTDNVVWQESDGRASSPVATTLDFAAGETKSFRASWNQLGADGAPVRTGSYEARGVLVYTGFDTNPLRSNQLGSTLERFTIN